MSFSRMRTQHRAVSRFARRETAKFPNTALQPLSMGKPLPASYALSWRIWLLLITGSSLGQDTSFNAQDQKELHAHYCQQAVQIERGDLDSICAVLKQYGMACYLGIIERPVDRGGHSLYCSIVYINEQGVIKSVHRKLQPTYEER